MQNDLPVSVALAKAPMPPWEHDRIWPGKSGFVSMCLKINKFSGIVKGPAYRPALQDRGIVAILIK
jgi:hypothetical protein